ncbi:MAG: hypothetical protein M1831_005577 [Alyxoria varia]|nr:MAG: hypothetical protein M1831_005577 [Alyxoria varia]
MLSRNIVVSRACAIRAARQQLPHQTSRTFVSTMQRQADPVQDIYLRHLREYKVPPVKASDAEGQVQKFSAPTAPRSPEEPNLANDLKAYEEQSVEVETQQQSDATAGAGGHQEWFEPEDFEKQDKEAEGHH